MLFITANVIRNGNGCGGPLPPYMLSFDPWFHVTTVILIDCCFCYPSYASDASACRFFCNAAVTNLLAYSAVVGELLLRKRFCCCWASLESNSAREGCADCRSIPGDPQRGGGGAVPVVLLEYWLESSSSWLLLSSYTAFCENYIVILNEGIQRPKDEIETKVLRVFLLAIQSHFYSFALSFLFLQTQATSYSFYRALLYVHCKGERMKTW